MKVRKLAVALALAGGLGSGVAQALGLGEVELQSYLNEPLDAEISLRKSSGIDPDNVFVNIASPQDFERVGLDRSHFLTRLDFEVTTAPDGSLVVNVTSREALREPYLNFLIEVTWPQGRLMREYAVLVDPPMYAEESGLQEEVTAPSATTPAPSSRSQTTSTSQRTDTTRSATRSAADSYGPTGASDTLWSIAEQVRTNNSLSIQQVMLALQDLNPDAFIGGNINRLKRGQVLRVPSTEQVRARTRAEANRLVNAQNRALQETSRPVDATQTAATNQAPAQGEPAGDELKLVVDDGDSQGDQEGGAAAGDGSSPGSVDAGEAVALEELEAARRENEELSSRLEDLQDQVGTLQRLLELKNTQLAEIQQMDGEEGTADGEGVAETTDDAGAVPPEGEVAEEPAEDVAGDGQDVTGADPSAETEEGEVAGDATAEAPVEGDDQMAAGEQGQPDEESMASEETAEEPAEAAPPASDQSDQTAQPEPAPQPDQSGQQKGFPGNVVDMILNNQLYQIALGAGLLVLLLLLLLLARKNANREKAFYEQLNSEAEGESDEVDLDVGGDEMPDLEGDDPLAEADAYIAYGRHDQAAVALETAISREPSRTDLRLKLLAIYADLKDRESFDKQFNEIEALEDDAATEQAEAMRGRLEEAEATPSIDELESQLRSSSPGETSSDDSGVTDQTLADQAGDDQPEDSSEFDSDFGSLGLDEPTTPDESGDQPEEWQNEAPAEYESSAPADDAHDMIEYDLSDLDSDKGEETAETDTAADTETSGRTEAEDDGFSFDIDEDALEGSDDSLTEESLPEEETDLSDSELELDDDVTGTDYSGFEESLEQSDRQQDEAADEDLGLDLSEEEDDFGLDLEPEDESAAPESLPGEELPTEEEKSAAGEEQEPAGQGEESIESDADDGDLGDLDESFLDELDAELDKVASEDDSASPRQDSLDDLELDVSDEDIALMEEFADSDAEEEPTSDIDEELGLEDAFTGEEEASPEDAAAADETLEDEAADLESGQDEVPELDTTSGEEPAQSGSQPATGKSALEMDESELGDEDDFDFLSGTDEAATKLDLARAYMEMGDADGARDILEEVALEGNDEQKAEAQDLLKNLS